jgi:hypothetical protein
MSELHFSQETRHPPTALLFQLTEKALFGAGQSLVRASVHLAATRQERFARRSRSTDIAALEHRTEQARQARARWLPPHRHL